MELWEYYKAHGRYFWQWEEDGEVLAIPGGETIAYRAYIADLLEKLAPQGLPPFGSLLLAIIATNPNGDSVVKTIYSLMNQQLASSNSTREPLNSAIGFLGMLSALPRKYREGHLRQQLLQTLFYESHNNISAAVSNNIAVLFNAKRQAQEWLATDQPFSANVYNKDFRTISLLYKKFPDISSLIQKMAGLPVIEETIQIEKTGDVAPEEGDLLDQLLENTQTWHVASLVKRLWSGLNIPHHNILPSQQPVGGVSDLTNKGQFDRLLISEFANDDIVFLSRLANNEALYINREIPPQNNDLERVILIDVSIRNWGTPRTLAYAITLAIASHPKTDIHCSVFAVGQHCYPLQVDSIDAIIRSLQLLDPCINAAEGIAAFFREHSFKKWEIFYIASHDSFRQAAIHRQLSEHYTSFSYWIHTGEEGNIDVYKRQQNSKKHVQHLCLPLKELWSKKPSPKPGKREPVEKEDPPLLYPLPFNVKRKLVTAQDEVFLVTAEKDIVIPAQRENSHKKGGIILYRDIPLRQQNILEIGKISGELYQLLLFDPEKKQVTIIDLSAKAQKQVAFRETVAWQNHFNFYDGKFYCGVPGSENWSFELTAEGIVVEKHLARIEGVVNRYNAKLKQQNNHYYSATSGSVLKNVTNVFINSDHNLILNKHEFCLTKHNVYSLRLTQSVNPLVKAKESGEGEFVFPDGSSVIIDRSGMIILCSSNPSLEKIYIPSVLSMPLGVATWSAFSGNDYFLPLNSLVAVTTPPEFFKKHLQPFLTTIIDGA